MVVGIDEAVSGTVEAPTPPVETALVGGAVGSGDVAGGVVMSCLAGACSEALERSSVTDMVDV